MIAIHHERLNLWLRLKLFLALGKGNPIGVKSAATKPKQRSHRATSFFDMP